MKEHKQRHGVKKMAEVLGASWSGYYAREGREMSQHKKTDLKLAGLIREIYKENHGRYGSPRIWAELKGRGWDVGRKRAERLMREQSLCARKRRKRVFTTDSRHLYEVSGNILNREFHSSHGGEKWVSDITYLRTMGGWLYLAVVIDLRDRKVIGWSMSKGLSAGGPCRALAMAVGNRRPRAGLIFHSDRGVQYCSEEFRLTLGKLCPAVRQSMSRKGNCWDNACAESFFKTLKTEMDVLGGNHSSKLVQAAVFEYIEIYYNRCRRHSALGYAAPVALTKTIAA